MRKIVGIDCPAAADLVRGAIIGCVEVIDVVKDSDSKWFMGPRGLVLRDPRPCDPVMCVGALGYFKWAPGTVSVETARWMRPLGIQATPAPKSERLDDLFEVKP